jgi:hypothetical protein
MTEEILRTVAEKYAVSVSDIRTVRYDRHIVAALSEAVGIMRGEGLSLKRIARAVNRTPRSTAAYFYGDRGNHRGAAPKGTAVYVRGAYLAKLREYAKRSETTIPALVNQAVSNMLEGRAA